MSEGIAHNNKDIIFKYMSELYQDATLDVFHLDLPKIERLLPNEFPVVRADAKRSDTVFLLEDRSILILEFESNTNYDENHLKYMRYAHEILQREFEKGEHKIRPIIIVVVYTSDVENVQYDGLVAEDVIIKSRPVLLSEYDGDGFMAEIEGKLNNEEDLTNEDLFKMSFLPLMKSSQKRQVLIEKTVELAKKIPVEVEQVQVIAGLLTSTDKFITPEYAKQVREWLKMTKVGRIFEEEKQEAVEIAVKIAKKEERIEMAKALLDLLSPEVIAKRFDLDIDEVKKLKK